MAFAGGNTLFGDLAVITGTGNSEPLDLTGYRLLSIQAGGTFGGTTLTFQMSNDGTTWSPLADVSMTAAGIVGVPIAPRYIRAVATGGSGINVRVSVYGVR